MTDAKKEAFQLGKAVHIAIGIGLMLFGRFIPAPSLVVEASQKLIDMGFPLVDGFTTITIAPIGMTILGIFLGVVYMWSFVDTLWPSFLGVILLGISEYAPMNVVLNSFMGNPIAIMQFFLFMFCAVLVKSQVGIYLAQWIITLKINEGRPWILTVFILLTTYIVAFIDQVSSVFIMWPVLYLIFNEVGFKKGDAYVTAMIAGTLLMALLSFAGDPIKTGAFTLLTNLYGLALSNPELHITPINSVSYFFFTVCLSSIIITIYLLSMRFIFRVDVSPLKLLDFEVLKKNKLPPMVWQQKAVIVIFLCYVLLMLLPSMLPKENVVALFFRENQMGSTLFAIFLLGFIQFRGESVADIAKTNAAYPWRVYFLIATAFLLGGALTSQVTNVSIFIEYLARDILYGLDYTVLAIASIIIAILLTNVCNSVTMGIILAPVLLSLSSTCGFSPYPLLACVFFTLLVAIATPAASPYAAMLFDNEEWVSRKDAFKYGIFISTVVVSVVIIVGIPLSLVLF